MILTFLWFSEDTKDEQYRANFRWTFATASDQGALNSVWQWILAVLGYAGNIFVMFSGARRLELRQNKNYGDDPEYQAYVKSVPILLPFIPLYSVVKYKFLVA